MPQLNNIKVVVVKNNANAKELEKLLLNNWSILNVAANNSIIVYTLIKR